jgi:hydroxymethylpyrimidine/phosphomethylpyrimidine kinase
MKQVLTIAGSDSGGGAGIQADLKAMAANGVYGLSVITTVTAQNTKGVTAVHDLPVPVVTAQLDAIFDDFDVAAVKTGMLSSAAIVEAVSRKLKDKKVANLVVDPVMIAKSGHPLLQQDAVDHLKAALIPLALIITPNVHEAEHLSGLPIKSLADARLAAKVIHKLGCKHVLIKGGHLLSEKGTDLLYDGRFFHVYKGEFIDTPHTHGTGCTFASAIAAQLAKGAALTEAVRIAKNYLTEAIRHHLAIGHGRGPTNHFYFLPRPEADREGS